MINLVPVLGKTIAAIASKMAIHLLSKRIMARIIISLIDWMVKETDNKIDDKVWADLRPALIHEFNIEE